MTQLSGRRRPPARSLSFPRRLSACGWMPPCNPPLKTGWVKLSKDSVEAMSGVNKESQPAEPIAAKKPKTAAAGKIEPKLGNFTRSKKGKQLMEEQVGRLLWLDGVKFDSNAHIVYTLSPK